MTRSSYSHCHTLHASALTGTASPNNWSLQDRVNSIDFSQVDSPTGPLHPQVHCNSSQVNTPLNCHNLELISPCHGFQSTCQSSRASRPVRCFNDGHTLRVSCSRTKYLHDSSKSKEDPLLNVEGPAQGEGLGKMMGTVEVDDYTSVLPPSSYCLIPKKVGQELGGGKVT
ncbi:hypothetical protein TIFTF001_016860 [Ficus carica]|uniref:Uncharacterized protein n=1 Tax=Ficus carica TaxID=3494 RepID=A0AA88AB62_FICCA|nr:hypothetical protein TIFTF001_016860 [Ficus carica]